RPSPDPPCLDHPPRPGPRLRGRSPGTTTQPRTISWRPPIESTGGAASGPPDSSNREPVPAEPCRSCTSLWEPRTVDIQDEVPGRPKTREGGAGRAGRMNPPAGKVGKENAKNGRRLPRTPW